MYSFLSPSLIRWLVVVAVCLTHPSNYWALSFNAITFHLRWAKWFCHFRHHRSFRSVGRRFGRTVDWWPFRVARATVSHKDGKDESKRPFVSIKYEPKNATQRATFRRLYATTARRSIYQKPPSSRNKNENNKYVTLKEHNTFQHRKRLAPHTHTHKALRIWFERWHSLFLYRDRDCRCCCRHFFSSSTASMFLPILFFQVCGFANFIIIVIVYFTMTFKNFLFTAPPFARSPFELFD